MKEEEVCRWAGDHTAIPPVTAIHTHPSHWIPQDGLHLFALSLNFKTRKMYLKFILNIQ